MLDLRIDGGTLIDGTGAPGRPGSLGVRDGRIVAIGEVTEDAKQVVDATGKIVCPGFIDIHTHYDAQAFWDGTLSPSLYHGVTTVVGGNCGFSIAPLAPGAGPYLMRMLARVEGMPLESLEEGVPWDWSGFGDYLSRLDGKLAVNSAFMVGHSALRRVVMGERAIGEEATEEETAQMVELLRQSIREGGMGFSSSIAQTHNDGEGQPVPSRHASREELVALAGAISDLPGTALEFLPGVGLFTDEQKQLMTDLSLAANRPLNWNVLAPTSQSAEMVEAQLGAGDFAAEQGAKVIALTVPQTPTVRINLVSGFIFDALPGWAPMFQMPIPERIALLRDPAERKRLNDGAQSEEAGLLRGLAIWERMIIDQVKNPSLEKWKGRTIGEIAAEQGKEPFDCMLDLAIEDELQTYFMPTPQEDDQATRELRAQVWRDPRAVIGASDAGAHLDMIDTFAFSTKVLEAVRRDSLISWEEAIEQLTDVPGRLYGLTHRGRLEEGWFADVTILDPETAASGPVYTRFDLPAGAGRLYADAHGIDHVFVNGEQIVREGKHTGALPGTVMRSGQDTETVEVPGGAS